MFENELNEALRAEKLLKESKRPSSGIWYYARFRDGWKLMTFPYGEYPAEGHENYWRKYVVPKLAVDWEFSSNKIRKLLDAYRGMPRGRVDLSASNQGFEVAGEKPNYWYFFHGNDFPAKVVKAEQSRLIDAFNLVGFALRGLVEFQFSEHETMLPEHERTVKAVLKEMTE